MCHQNETNFVFGRSSLYFETERVLSRVKIKTGRSFDKWVSKTDSETSNALIASPGLLVFAFVFMLMATVGRTISQCNRSKGFAL